jgi:hypothetical protein
VALSAEGGDRAIAGECPPEKERINSETASLTMAEFSVDARHRLQYRPNVYIIVMDRQQIFMSRYLRSKSRPRYFFISFACSLANACSPVASGRRELGAIGTHIAHGRSPPDSVDLSLSSRA